MLPVSEGVRPALLEQTAGVSHLPRALLHLAVLRWELPAHLLLLNIHNGNLQAICFHDENPDKYLVFSNSPASLSIFTLWPLAGSSERRLRGSSSEVSIFQ